MRIARTFVVGTLLLSAGATPGCKQTAAKEAEAIEQKWSFAPVSPETTTGGYQLSFSAPKAWTVPGQTYVMHRAPKGHAEDAWKQSVSARVKNIDPEFSPVTQSALEESADVFGHRCRRRKGDDLDPNDKPGVDFHFAAERTERGYAVHRWLKPKQEMFPGCILVYERWQEQGKVLQCETYWELKLREWPKDPADYLKVLSRVCATAKLEPNEAR